MAALSGRTLCRGTWWWTAATVVAVLVVVTGVMIRSHRPSQVASDAVTVYTTAKAEQANIVLPDGTRVVLNVASRIEIPRRFGERDRVVRLQGEAYFDVTHTAGAPFVIETEGVRTTALGTAFGVQAYQPTHVQVSVRSGKVAVNNVVLVAHDIAHVSVGGAVVVAHDQLLDNALAFMHGRLVVANRLLRDALPDLDRWFAVEIRLADPSLGDLRFDAVLMSGSVGDLMKMLKNTLDVRVVRDGRTLTLYAR
jgi:ferric-dicitrate binding protein FerR (iron transport regulator)